MKECKEKYNMTQEQYDSIFGWCPVKWEKEKGKDK